MNARRRALTGLAWLCAMATAMLFASVPALAAEEHPYLPSRSLIDQTKDGGACGVVTDSNGNVYVSENFGKKVKVFSPTTGKQITEFATPSNGAGPCSLAVDSNGAVYVQDFSGEVLKYKPSAFPPTESTKYALEESAGTKGVIVAKSAKAHGIAVDPETHNLYVAEGSHISSFKPNGELLSATIGEGLVSEPNYFGIDVYGATGDVYVTDTTHAKAYILNPAGTEILTETAGPGGAAGVFGPELSSVAVDQSDGAFYVFSTNPHEIGSSAVYEFDSSGGFLSKIGHTFDGSLFLENSGPSDIAVDNGSASPNAGDVYVSSQDKPHVADSVYAFGPRVAAAEHRLTVERREIAGQTGVGKGEVVSEPLGIECGLSCEASFATDSTVKLTETPEAGSTFVTWSGGGCSGAASVCEVPLNDDATVTATFVVATKDKLTIATGGSGTGKVECEANASGHFEACASEYPEGTKLTLEGVAEAGSTFAGFSGGSGSASACSGTGNCTFTLSEASSLTATFNVAPKDKLTISTGGSGSGKVECELGSNPGHFEACASEYPEGTKLTLKGLAEAGSSFGGWSAGTGSAASCSGTANCSFTLGAESSLTATFDVAPKDKLTIAKAGTGTGKVECEVGSSGSFGACASEYPEGTRLTLKGAAEAGSSFAGFSGGSGSASACTGTANCSFTLGAESSLTATFNVKTTPEDKLTIAKAGGGAGRVECEVGSSGTFGACASEYPEGTKLTVTGVAEAGSSFVGWSAGTGSAASCTGRFSCSFTLGAESSLSATFDVVDKLTIAGAGRGVGRVACEVESSGEFEVCAGDYPAGTRLTLMGAAEAGSSFAGFSGGSGSASACTGTTDCSFTLSAESSLTATFGLLPTPEDKLTIAKAGGGAGQVECEVGSSGTFGACASEYPEGTKLTLKGVAEAGSTFAGFSGGSGSASACSGTGNCSFTLRAESSVTATFNAPTARGTAAELEAQGKLPGIEVLAFPQDLLPTEAAAPGTGSLTIRGSATASGAHARITLACSSVGPCTAQLTLTTKVKRGQGAQTVVIGRALVEIPAGQSKTISLQLSKVAVGLLRRRGSMAAKLTGPGTGLTITIERSPSHK